MNTNEIKNYEAEYVAQTYRRFDLCIASGKSATAMDLDGKSYIDFSSGIGVNSLGFGNTAWVEAIKHQLDTLGHISNLYYTTPMVELAKKLCERTGMKRVFFGNSGAEANEGAIKTARKYGADTKGKDCYEIICIENSYHGRTIATLAATGQDSFHVNFGPFPDGFVFAKTDDLDSVKALIGPKTCAIMVECIQGEGGVIGLDAGYLRGIGELCAKNDILLIVDEVQTGIGRTGAFLSLEHYGLKPDIVTLAKGLGGGLPIGAVLFGEKVKDTLGKGDHGSTFGGNPIVCAGALAILEIVNEEFLQEVTKKGDYLLERLSAMEGVVAVTGKGMMLGLSLEAPLTSTDVVNACIKKGLIILTAKEKVRLLPPLTITDEELDKGLAILASALQECKAGL